jgi:hypothetical protein
MYLQEFKLRGNVYDKVTGIAGKYGISVKEFQNSDLISSSVTFNSAGQSRILLSEFPGNCSSLILSNIQSSFYSAGLTQYIKNNLDCAIEICIALKYGSLFISGTSGYMRKVLIEEYGFKVILDELMNPHSGSLNYFLVKKFDYTINEEPVIEEELEEEEDPDDDPEEEESFLIVEDIEDPDDIEMHRYLDTRSST